MAKRIRSFLLSPVTDQILQMEDRIMSTLSDAVATDQQVEAEVTQLGTDVAAIITALQDVEAQLTALQNAGLTAEQQAQVDALNTSLTAAKASLTTLSTNIQAALPAAP